MDDRSQNAKIQFAEFRTLQGPFSKFWEPASILDATQCFWFSTRIK